MSDNVVRFASYEKRSRKPDGVPCRDPADCEIIILPIVRVERSRWPIVRVEQPRSPIVILALPEAAPDLGANLDVDALVRDFFS